MTTADLTPAAALRAHDLRVAYDGTEVLRGMDLELRTGEWLGLIGPNGSGKSTLLRALVGLVPSSGSVELGTGGTPGPTDLSLMPQSPELPPGMTVVEYVLLGRTAHLGWLRSESESDRRVAIDVLRRLGLASFAGRTVRQLSGGEAQRVVIARALAQQSPVLLLDEPTSALDVGHQVEVLELVDELRREDGLTVVAAMHDLGTAARYADRLALLDRGSLAALGSPAEVLSEDLVSRVYGHPVRVHELDGHLVVVPAPRVPRRTGAPGPVPLPVRTRPQRPDLGVS
ncbi:ABC transporter ATP-binding protein [Ornithinimicrobium humiphilum]|uniref:Iron complex transport system ATP-binding protein n=1 Tax=Ornithinimicrobium humiphilum TaxID=125288 RepID=A0A543K6W2_9MICO|nr:ABC transporter ATP-binding protein [Ornithinimicrobium humiphilum]TQM90811.1 iron complex transport system ATP-binding protein [Ornithinimicrobium humiphilum]